MTWLTADAVLRLPVGVAVVLELNRHTARLRGRVLARVGDELTLETYGGRQETIRRAELRRGRAVDSIFDPADPVLLAGVPASRWRGGVVRTEGRRVLVEEMDSSFAWRDESELERPEDALTEVKTA